jgi:hypothetical protein
MESKKLNWEYKSIAELPGSLILRDHLQQPTTLRQMEVTQAKETLGLSIAANGNQITQMQVLLLLVERWIDKICTKQLIKTEAWLSLQMGVAKSLRYPLTATCLSIKDCETLDKKLLAAALPALGFSSKYPHKIAQAPPEALGLGIPSIWNDEGIDHVTAMLRHGDSNPKNITGCLFRDAMMTLRFELGLPGYPFDHSYKRFNLCSTPIYLHCAWEFCNEEHEFRIQDNQPQLTLRRIDDQYIMQAFADHGYTDK